MALVALSEPNEHRHRDAELNVHQREHDIPQIPTPLVDQSSRRISRAQMLAWAGAGMAFAAFPHSTSASVSPARLEFPFYPGVQGTYTPEDIRDILNILATMEHFAVAAIMGNLSGAIDPTINPLQITIERAALVKAVAHVDFLESVGGHALTDTFTTGPGAPFAAASLKGKEGSTTIFVGAYMTAAREFAELGQPLLVKWAFQAGAEEAEERALARAMMAVQNVPDSTPPNNKAFETDLFLYVRDAYALMTRNGLFGGLPRRLPYPSREQVLALAGATGAMVLQKAPNNASVSIISPGDVTRERL